MAKRKKIYIRFNSQTGVYENHREVTRGRRPLGCIKFNVEDDGNVTLAEGEKLPAKAQLDTIPDNVSTAPTKQPQDPLIVRLKMDTPMDPVKLAARIKAGASSKSGKRWTFHMCDIVGEAPCSYLEKHRTHSRIDMDLGKGELHVWNIEYSEGFPDVIIENAIKDPVKCGS